ncbi:MAG: type II secretion system protein [Phycisphaerales bacterium]
MKKIKHKKALKMGFTLVELLVVISIIALLLAVLIPAMSKAKEAARTVVCLTNMKSYSLASAMYANDNGNSFPSEFFLYSYRTIYPKMGKNVVYIPRACRWHYSKDTPDGSMWPYFKDKNVHICPTFKGYAFAGGPSICPNPNHDAALNDLFEPMFSYSMNAALVVSESEVYLNGPTTTKDGLNWKRQGRAPKLLDVKRPADCMLFAEENVGWAVAKGVRPAKNYPDDTTYIYSRSVLNDNLLVIENGKNCSDNIATFHKVSTSNKSQGYGDCVFVDGHIKSVWGRPGGTPAFMEYGLPYKGYEAIWR